MYSNSVYWPGEFRGATQRIGDTSGVGAGPWVGLRQWESKETVTVAVLP